jgi:hypothetical protein
MFQYIHMRAQLPSEEEVFDSGMQQLTTNLEGFLGYLARTNPPYEQRGWARDVFEAAIDFLTPGFQGDPAYLTQALDSPPQGAPESLVNRVRDIVNEALGLPRTDKQREAVRNALETILDHIVTGLPPGQAPPQSSMRRYQGAVIEKEQSR